MSNENETNEAHEEKIKMLEERIREFEKEKETKEEVVREKESEMKKLRQKEMERGKGASIVEELVGQFIPGLGGIVKTLEAASPEFRKRIAETDVEIKHRIETGWNREHKIMHRSFARSPIKPKVDFDISINDLISSKHERKGKRPKDMEVRAPEIKREPVIDVFENDYISVIAEIPGIEESEIEIKITDNILDISVGKYRKTIKLPSLPKSIIEKTYRNGILQLKMEKEHGN